MNKNVSSIMRYKKRASLNVPSDGVLGFDCMQNGSSDCFHYSDVE